jgi:membrane protein implicated in regulation of membrane protease activity
MLTIIALILAFTVLPSPWGVVAILSAAAVDVVEVRFFARWSKRRRATVGAETLIGRTGVVVRTLSPRGQVRLDGEIWEARASGGDLSPGAEVVVTGRDGLVLEVEPTA